MTKDEFHKSVLDFIERTGMTPSALGVKALKDSNFVSDLEAGRSPSLRTCERVTSFMDSYDKAEAAQ